MCVRSHINGCCVFLIFSKESVQLVRVILVSNCVGQHFDRLKNIEQTVYNVVKEPLIGLLVWTQVGHEIEQTLKEGNELDALAFVVRAGFLELTVLLKVALQHFRLDLLREFLEQNLAQLKHFYVRVQKI